MERSAERAVWERRPEESLQAHEAFQVYLALGPGRTFVAAARQLRKSGSLLRRWADRHGWRERAWQYDLSRDREAEAVVRRELAESVKRQLRDAEHFDLLATKGVSQLVVRDPTTGRLALARDLSVAEADRLYRLGLHIEKQWLGQTREATREGEGGDRPDMLSNEELRQLVALARERAGLKPEEASDDSETDAPGEAGDHSAS